MNRIKSLFGEFLGTFILTFIGCSTVDVAVLFGVFPNIIPIALIWGAGVTIAIYATTAYSPAHLNPAVSTGFYLLGEIKLKQLFSFWVMQLFGGILAGLSVYLVFQSEITAFELSNTIIRGGEASIITGSIFGEFFPNPGYINEIPSLSVLAASGYEAVGTALLMGGILFIISNKFLKRLAPVFIGLLVAILIMWIAPYTQCGMNPARDFGPRIAAFFLGWDKAAFPVPNFSFLIVYIVSPILGASIAALGSKKIP